jgi:hypothetical protein
MKKACAYLLAAALALGLPPPPAQAQNPAYREIPLATLYDLDATSYTYLWTTGEQGYILGRDRAIATRITTSGSSTTVAAVTASSGPFDLVAAGDEICFLLPQGSGPSPAAGNVRTCRKVTARASADSITVNAAVDIGTNSTGGVPFTFRTFATGTAAGSGWFPVSSYTGVSVQLMVSQISVTGQIEFKIQCRGGGVDNAPVDVYAEGMTQYRTGGYNAAQVDNDTIIVHNGVVLFSECRVGALIDSADDGSDTGADAEQVSVKLILSGQSS